MQLIVKLMPQNFRHRLRTNMSLSALYTAWLCRVKLHPSVNPKIANTHQFVAKGDSLYQACQKHHYSLLEMAKAEKAHKRHVSAVVILFDSSRSDDELENSINSVTQAEESVEHIIVLCFSAGEKKKLGRINRRYKQVKIIDRNDVRSRRLPAGFSALLEQDAQAVFVICHGDLLHPLALIALNRATLTADMAYTDVDRIDDGQRYDPAFMPDWNPDLLLSTAYINRAVLLLNPMLQLNELINCNNSVSEYIKSTYLNNIYCDIDHIPFILVHVSSESTPRLAPIDTSIMFENEHKPLVSLIIPTYNGVKILKDCVDSIIKKTTYANYEICIVNNNSDDPETLEYLSEIALHTKVEVLDFPYPFNYSAINNFAVKRVSGEIIGLINNDIEVITPNWLQKMVNHVCREDVGCVGAKLLYSNDLVQHAGVVMGYGGGAGHAHKYLPCHRSGYMQRAVATQNFSAVTAACLLVTRADYDAVGGLNETDLTVAFNDVDFCLSICGLGKRNVWVAEALLYHHESISRGHEDTVEKQKRFQAEVTYLQTKWDAYIKHDPAYNPNLTLQYENFSIDENLKPISL
ncbi:glycosyltransferase family 2 protein [Ningiella sp. W23]|uniref:glycosyltransferase family 2 protein n=1 Tax=Ningiella sp. W23 TaxID=3023715 RepID=UPI0037577DA0